VPATHPMAASFHDLRSPAGSVAPGAREAVDPSLQLVKFDNAGVCLHTGSEMTAPAEMRSSSTHTLSRAATLTLGLVLLTVILILPL